MSLSQNPSLSLNLILNPTLSQMVRSSMDQLLLLSTTLNALSMPSALSAAKPGGQLTLT